MLRGLPKNCMAILSYNDGHVFAWQNSHFIIHEARFNDCIEDDVWKYLDLHLSLKHAGLK